MTIFFRPQTTFNPPIKQRTSEDMLIDDYKKGTLEQGLYSRLDVSRPVFLDEKALNAYPEMIGKLIPLLEKMKEKVEWKMSLFPIDDLQNQLEAEVKNQPPNSKLINEIQNQLNAKLEKIQIHESYSPYFTNKAFLVKMVGLNRTSINHFHENILKAMELCQK